MFLHDAPCKTSAIYKISTFLEDVNISWISLIHQKSTNILQNKNISIDVNVFNFPLHHILEIKINQIFFCKVNLYVDIALWTAILKHNLGAKMLYNLKQVTT